jgi:hypothetical protein
MTDEKETTWWEASQELSKLIEKSNNDLDEMADKCPSELKLAVTRWAMKHIVDHAREGGSYRYLIYTRLGFGPEAYVPLCDDGLTISNEFDISNMDAIKEKVREEKIESLKPLLHLCDEPGCFKNAGCGWPSEDGYRRTCGDHYREQKK